MAPPFLGRGLLLSCEAVLLLVDLEMDAEEELLSNLPKTFFSVFLAALTLGLLDFA